MRHISALIVTLVLAVTSVHAERVFVATLDGLQNVPPHPEVTASGSATLVLNDAETELTFHIEYSGLSSPEVAAHIHNAAARDNGPVAFPLPAGEPKDGVWMLTPADIIHLTTKQLYINIHTVDYESGEIRGNILEMATPVEPTTWGAIKALYTVE